MQIAGCAAALPPPLASVVLRVSAGRFRSLGKVSRSSRCKPDACRNRAWAESERVAREQERTLAPLSDDLALLASGLDSLCLAIIIARLENTLGFDPFVTPDGVNLLVTVGNFIKSYEEVLNRAPAIPPVPSDRP